MVWDVKKSVIRITRWLAVENPSEERALCGGPRRNSYSCRVNFTAAAGATKKKKSSFDPIDRADRVRAASRWTLEHPTKIMGRELIN